MSEHDDDIDFDFFSDPEPAPPKRRLVRRPSGPPPGEPPRRTPGPAPTVTPFLRLVSLIAFAVAVVLILVFAVRSCQTSGRNKAYTNYVNDANRIGADSQGIGKQLTDLLSNSNLTEKSLEDKLKGLIDQQDLDIENARKLTPPGPLREAQARMVEALQLRRNGLNGMLAAFQKTANKRDSVQAGRLLSDQARRLVASDVVWDDLFVYPARAVLKKQKVSGVAPLSSVFLADPDFSSRSSMTVFWQRLHGVSTGGTSTAGGTHGTQITYVKVYPSGKQLVAGEIPTIKIVPNLNFEVGVLNGGNFMEQNIAVTLVINQPSSPIKKTETIAQIFNGDTKAVSFRNFNLDVGFFGQVVKVKVDVAPVAGETFRTNNTATYEVRFSL